MSTSPLGISLDTTAFDPSRASDSDDSDTPTMTARGLHTHAPQSSEQSTAPTEQDSEPAADTRRRKGRVSDQSTTSDSSAFSGWSGSSGYSGASADTASGVQISGPYDAETEELIPRLGSLPELQTRYLRDRPAPKPRAVSLTEPRLH